MHDISDLIAHTGTGTLSKRVEKNDENKIKTFGGVTNLPKRKKKFQIGSIWKMFLSSCKFTISFILWEPGNDSMTKNPTGELKKRLFYR